MIQTILRFIASLFHSYQIPQKDVWDKLAIAGTWALVIVGFLAIVFLWRQTNLMSRTLIFQFRPKLIIRNATLETPEGEPARILYSVANVGGTDAKIVNTDLKVLYIGVNLVNAKKEPLTPPAHEQKVLWEKSVLLHAGQDTQLSITLDSTIVERLGFLRDQRKWGTTNPELVGQLSLRGKLYYTDESNITRNIGIQRYLDVEKKRLFATPDSEYDYAD